MTLRFVLAPLAAMLLISCSTDEPAGEGCEPGLLKCVGADVAICTEDGSAFTLFKECGPAGECQAGLCVGGGEDGGGEGDSNEGEGETPDGDGGSPDGGDEGGDGGEGEEGDGGDDPGDGGEGEAVDGEGEGEGADGEGGGEGEGEGGPDEGGEGEGEGGDGGEGEGEGGGDDDRCDPDPECPGNQRCDPASGDCLEPFVCEGPEDCTGDRFCFRERCADPCDDEDDCVGARTCDRESGRCLEPALCIVPEDCDLGRECIAGRCTIVCGRDEDCPGLQSCDVPSRRCEEPARCQGDIDCERLRVCQGQVCSEPCVDDEACEGRQRCDRDTGRCVAPGVCQGDQDCPGATLCRAGECLVPGCESHSDCAGACVDARCVAAAPVQCADDGDCGGDLACEAVDACSQVTPCEGAGDCDASAPMCDRGRCVDCAVDGDCARAEVCEEGGCLLVLGCQADRDCPGARECEEERCVPAACEGDRVDRGASTNQLTDQAYTDFVLCDGDVDIYRFDLPANLGLSVVLRHDGEAGDLSLALQEAGPPPVPLVHSDGRFATERVGLDAAQGVRFINVVVRGAAGGDVDYSLELRLHGAQWCAPDRFEGLGSDDRQALGTAAGVGAYEHVVCPGDSDWFNVPVAAGTRLTVRATPAQGGAGSVRLTIHDEAGQQIEQGQAAGDGQRAQLDVDEGGRLGVRVRAADEDDRVAVTLQIEAEASPNAVDEACPGRPLQFDEAWPLPPTLPVRRVSSSCAPEGGADHLASFELESSAFVTARFEGPEPGSSLAILADCGVAESELACGFDLRAGLDRVLLEEGTYTLLATGPAGVRAAVRLTKEDACAGDGDCAGDLVCVGEICRDPCADDGDCQGRQTCDQGTGHCVEPVVCDGDLDCGGRRVCEHGECIIPECNVHLECADEAACVDRRCLDGEPGACADDDDCPGGLTCSDVQVCAQDGPCEEDDDCPAGAPLCNDDGGVCALCLEEGDCDNGEFCRLGECVYIGQCIGGDDDDCPGERTCGDDDRCDAAGGCRDDGQRDRARLTLRTYTGLVLCDDDMDRFILSVPPQRGAVVAVRHDAGIGDLALTLRNPATGAALATSDSKTGLELAGVATSPLQRDVEIQVTGRPAGVHVVYSLSLRPAEAGFCPPDALEGAQGNDVADNASPIAPGGHELELCTGEADHLSLTLSAGTRLTARLRPRVGVLDAVTAELLAPDGEVLASADGADPDALAADGALVVEADAVARGAHLIRLTHAGGEAPPVSLRVEVGADAAPDAADLACAAPEAITPGDPFTFPRTVQVRRVALSCGIGWGGDYVAAFDLNAPRLATVEVQGLANATAVAIAPACDSEEDEEAACGFAQEVPINGTALNAGTWYVLVESTDDPPPPILLTLQ